MAGNHNSGRKPKPRQPKPEKYCCFCGQPISGGRRRYCSSAHKQADYRRRKAQIATVSTETVPPDAAEDSPAVNTWSEK